ncbi:aminoglycoside phosphotransferase family protein [Halobacillus shinanisalinarum]|uniref:Aminoglycoside phosphotransferase family protein n=1 Tax=Halobacillus shinanisalinarum TaxID=2932258 RepID=A0ABY4GTV2_9BACI|nr:aminoglycoside phosphotransferase family protein [Halobacillus shinanisalinarum]UOQ91583.1 aminoglycoside phosphotransferase family protein [Halobacillus shinanisalinarum]
MSIESIISELVNKGVIDSNYEEYKPLVGGTSSHLGVFRYSDDTKFVLKVNEREVIKEEANFLNYYSNILLLPRVLYVEPSYEYILYSFIEGDTSYPRENKSGILKELVRRFINHYEPVSYFKGRGWADDLSVTWQEFLLGEFYEAKKILDSTLGEKEFNIVLRLINNSKMSHMDRQPFLLHGDCGVHNLLFKENKLCGVIDPTPMIGDPLFDLVYAYCSSPDDLTIETITSATELLVSNTKSKECIYEEVLVGLYLRLARCTKHHPKDLNEYLKAWRYWKEIVYG